MSSAASRVASTLWAQQIYAKTKVLFSKYLLLTNTAITVGLSTAGDLMQQRYEKLCKRQDRWNATRTRNVAMSGLAIGPVCHYWYLILDHFLPGKKFSVILKKIFWDQIIMSSVCVLSYITVVGFGEGLKPAELAQEVKHKGPTLLKAEWLVWPPAQLINFAFLPTRYRVLYDNTVSLGFDYYYSYVMYSMYRNEYFKGQDLEEVLHQEENIHHLNVIRSVPLHVYVQTRDYEHRRLKVARLEQLNSVGDF